MTIEISNLRRPGEILDSSKLAELGRRIAGGIREDSRGQAIATSTISGRTIRITAKRLNPKTGKFANTTRDEQTMLAGRISGFLNNNQVSHDIRVT